MVESIGQSYRNHELVTSGFIDQQINKMFIRATLTEEELVFSGIDMPDVTIRDLKKAPPTDIKSAMAEVSLRPHPNVVCPEIYHVPVFK